MEMCLPVWSLDSDMLRGSASGCLLACHVAAAPNLVLVLASVNEARLLLVLVGDVSESIVAVDAPIEVGESIV